MDPVYDPALIILLEQLQLQSGRMRSEDIKLPADAGAHFADIVVEARFGPSPSGDLRDSMRRVRDSALSEWDTLSSQRSPSNYELPWQYAVLSHRFGRVHDSASEHSMGISEWPLLGTIDTGVVNAMCYRPPRPIAGHLLLFESEMFAFCSTMAAAFVHCLPVTRNSNGFLEYDFNLGAVHARLSADSDARRRFLLPILTYATTGRPSNTPYFPVIQDYSQLSSIYRLSMEFFVVAHEYGHLMAGHLDESTARAEMLGDLEVEAFSHSWQRELVADLLGIRLSIPIVMQDFRLDPSPSFMGITLYFSLVDFIDRAVSVLETGRVYARKLGSHPPASLRNANIRDHLPSIFAAHDPLIFESALKGSAQISAIIELIWKMCFPRLLTAREAGIKPWAKWRTVPNLGRPSGAH